MGGSYSAAEIAELRQELATDIYSNFALPDIGLHSSVLNYSGLDSGAVLREHARQLQYEGGFNPATFVEGLGTALGGLTSVPDAVGLGAFMISMLLNALFQSVGAPAEDFGKLLREVFAEEKASDVQSQMDEYVKRYSMYLHDKGMLIAETRRLEQQLSGLVTCLRNSMLRDGHVTSRALKHWVNGAAFHTQMVIHLARLERKDAAPARALLKLYRADLDNLLSRYKQHRMASLTLDIRTPGGCFTARRRRKRFLGVMVDCWLCDSEQGKITRVPYSDTSVCKQGTADIVSEKFFSAHVTPLQTYFAELDKNLAQLINQHETFFIEDFA